jgi:hypothetical protein
MSKGKRDRERREKHPHVNPWAPKGPTLAELMANDPSYLDKACAEAVARRDRTQVNSRIIRSGEIGGFGRGADSYPSSSGPSAYSSYSGGLTHRWGLW